MSAPQQNTQPGATTNSSTFGTTTGNTGTSAPTAAPSFSLNTGNNPSGLFGNTGTGSSFFTNPTSSGSFFGKPTTPTTGAPSSGAPGTASGLFGGTATTTNTSSIFGRAASLALGVPSSTAPASSLGGAAAGTTPTTTAANTTGSSFFNIPPASSSQSIFGNLGGTGAPAPATSKPGSFVPLTPSATTTPPAATGTSSFFPSTTKDTQSKDGTTPSAAPTGGLFSAVPPKNDNAEKKDASAAASPFNLFGSRDKDASSENKGTTTRKTHSCILQMVRHNTRVATPGLFGTKPGAAAAGSGATTTPTGSTLAPKEGDKAKDAASPCTSIAVAPPSVLKGKTIEEIVNKWSSDLENQVREFNKFAAEVAVWDRALMENGNNLAALYSHVVAVEREQTDIEQTLDHIEQQQRDLSATLDAYERSTEEILGTQGGSLRSLDTGPADTERDKNYVLATELHAHLDDLSTSLTQMIDSVNTLSLSTTNNLSPHSGDDPMIQISQILNSHLESLQWIDGAVREVEGKVTEVERRVRDAGLGNTLGNGLPRPRGFGLPR
ncbi:Nsp1-like C-terminal region-domain-containing protein [Pisolithus croceorrhizus]|nr:Nsp1-like C-terminal region-domain-containing protein [Pisolithus croceorrhizus]